MGITLRKIEIYGLKVKREINSGTDLARLIADEAGRQAGGIKDGSKGTPSLNSQRSYCESGL